MVKFAQELEEQLYKKRYGCANLSIVSTFLNKYSILLEMKRYHDAALAVEMAQKYVK